jgi:hypothetical protein
VIKNEENTDLNEEVKEENVNQDDANKEVNLSTNNVSKEENMRTNTINEEEKIINIYTIKLTERTIKGKIKIGPNDINKDIQIISSFENYRKIKKLEDAENNSKYKNEKEIRENITIKINKKKLIFLIIIILKRKEFMKLNIHLKII